MDPIRELPDSTIETEDWGTERGMDLSCQLRSIGQELERQRFAAFDLQWMNEHVLATGQPATRRGKPLPELLRNLIPGRHKSRPDAGESPLRFSPREIDAFDRRGKADRKDFNNMPDPYSLSQILRGVGSFLDRTGADPLTVSLQGKWVRIQYRTSQGKVEQVQHHLEYFYDYWATMYLRRSNRPPPSEPNAPLRGS